MARLLRALSISARWGAYAFKISARRGAYVSAYFFALARCFSRGRPFAATRHRAAPPLRTERGRDRGSSPLAARGSRRRRFAFSRSQSSEIEMSVMVKREDGSSMKPAFASAALSTYGPIGGRVTGFDGSVSFIKRRRASPIGNLLFLNSSSGHSHEGERSGGWVTHRLFELASRIVIRVNAPRRLLQEFIFPLRQRTPAVLSAAVTCVDRLALRAGYSGKVLLGVRGLGGPVVAASRSPRRRRLSGRSRLLSCRLPWSCRLSRPGPSGARSTSSWSW